MDDHPAPPPPPPPPPHIVVLRTTNDILKHTTSIFSTTTNLLMLLLLSILLLSLRINVEMATDSLTSFMDNDPSLKPLIYRIHGTPDSTSATTRRPFPNLSRAGILDDGYFSDDSNRRFFRSKTSKLPQLNSTSFILDSFDPQLGFSNLVSGDGIFRSIEIIEKQQNVVVDGINDSATFNGSIESKTDFHESIALLILIVDFCNSYLFMVLGVIAVYSIVHGNIFVLVLNDFCERRNSFAVNFSNGLILGLKRLHRFIAWRIVTRDTLSTLLSVWFFILIKDPYSRLKIAVTYQFMPFSVMSPWVKGFEKEINGFLVSWVVLDLFMSYVFSVGAWIAMADSRRNRGEVVEEGYRLLSLMVETAVNLKFFEVIACGTVARSLITRHFGVLFALAFQSFMEVYFMVAWMVYFLSVKSSEANSRGQPFGQRELEAMLVDV